MKIFVILFFCILSMFISCKGQKFKEPSNKKKILSITINEIGGMTAPSDTQYCFVINDSCGYKVRNIYLRKTNTLTQDSTILSKTDYYTAYKLIDSLPQFVLDSNIYKYGESINVNDGSYLHLSINLNDKKQINIDDLNLPNALKKYIDSAQKIYFMLYSSCRTPNY